MFSRATATWKMTNAGMQSEVEKKINKAGAELAGMYVLDPRYSLVFFYTKILTIILHLYEPHSSISVCSTEYTSFVIGGQAPLSSMCSCKISLGLPPQGWVTLGTCSTASFT